MSSSVRQDHVHHLPKRLGTNSVLICCNLVEPGASDVHIPVNRVTSTPYGYGFVRFITKDEAQQFVDRFGGSEFYGKRISMSIA